MNEPGCDGESIAARDQAVRASVAACCTWLTAALVLATAFASLARWYWFADLAVHFRLQYAGLAFVLFILLAWCRRHLWAAVAFAIAVMNAIIAAPVIMGERSPGPAASAEATPLRVAAVNVLYRSRQYEPTLEFARNAHADLIVFCEVNDRWRQALAGLDKQYPFRHETRGRRAHGLTLLSRWPLADARVVPLQDPGEPALAATINVRGHRVRVFAVHASWPINPRTASIRNRQLARLAEIVREHKGTVIVLGDLNISPFSPHFEALIDRGGLRSAATGFGWQPTWPSFLPPAGIQIDHVLVTADVAVRAFGRGPVLGSDHRPVVADLVLQGP